MADYGDASGGYSDQAIRDIVAALGGPAPAAAAPSVAPEVTPTMTYAAPAAPLGTGWGPTQQVAPVAQIQGPYDIMPARDPQEQARRDRVFPGGSAAREDDWAPAAPTMIAPAVTPLGTLATVQRQAPRMGVVLGRPQ